MNENGKWIAVDNDAKMMLLGKEKEVELIALELELEGEEGKQTWKKKKHIEEVGWYHVSSILQCQYQW